ncbi:succinate CoA transferase [Mycobacterium sp. pUA109]|uniref:succinate CoA transferase n=1 Tax=Mycobacterium sp. pUA109 TaxID=3238982 RepID=UPI00351AFE37
MSGRIADPALARKISSAEDAAAMIADGDNVGMSGFTGAGHPKAVPTALADRIAAGDRLRIGVWTGAGTAPELDGALAAVDGIGLRLPYQSDPVQRTKINTGAMEYLDLHIAHVAPMARHGALGHLDVAVIEVAGITPAGELIPATSVGNNDTWLQLADRVILEVNSWHSENLDGVHDICCGNGAPIPITAPGDRVGVPHLHCPADKVIAVVETHAPEGNGAFTPPDAASRRIAEHVLDFLCAEVAAGRIPPTLPPLQSGVGNVANAVLAGLQDGPFDRLTAYTEVISDGMLALIDSGTMVVASATSLSLSTEAIERFRAGDYRDTVVLRPAEISNHPEVVRRLGVIAMNSMIEADIYGNINSSHVLGSQMMNGIGGSGDFARNGYLSMFVTPSTAKHGAVSTIVPMVSHVDHTEHDVDVIVTEQGLADLRGLSPKQRARRIIERCAHPDFAPRLADYFGRALRFSPGQHTPHLLDEALSWHTRYLAEQTMRQQ